jgi:hypothetical protein
MPKSTTLAAVVPAKPAQKPHNEPLELVCAWCVAAGKVGAPKHRNVTHGICDECFRGTLDQLSTPAPRRAVAPWLLSFFLD